MCIHAYTLFHVCSPRKDIYCPYTSYLSCYKWASVDVCVCVKTRVPPVVRTFSICHCGVSLVCDQPVESLVCEEADVLPVGAFYIRAACIEVAQQHDVLQGE